ncbi:MAG: hypothetical protein JWN83_1937 [Chitinophagaceae bacterium]|nr:hypothetical protein [Chitinophagaceae bacterium]
MKFCLFAVALLIFSCQTKINSTQANNQDSTLNNSEVNNSQSQNSIHYWVGNINSNIPIFLWVIVKDSLIQGELFYTKSKSSTPIRILGNIPKEGDIRICEYQRDGTITGVFNFSKLDSAFEGIWASTKNQKELKFKLSAKDTLLTNIDTSFQPKDIAGNYSYAYGEKGYQGGLNVTKITDDKISFDISSVTSDPSRNIASIDTDTVAIYNNQFIYKIPNSDSCEFRVKFLRDFIFIDYTKGYGDCDGFFGLNASVDGIFIKVKSKK